MNSEKETVIIGDKKYYVIDGHLNLSKKNINAISEIIGLNKLTNLYSLDLSDNFIETINGLENLKNLQSLNLDNNLITKIQGLENFQNLRELKLGTKEKVEFGISKIEGLENLIKLRFLFIKVSFLDEINGLENLKRLEKLSILKTSYIYRSDSCKVIGLSELTNLKKISLQGLRLGTLEYFKDLEQLEELIVKDCRIEEINYLSRLCNLKILDLSDNSGIKTIKGLENLKNLTELIINDCFCVTKISGLDSLKNLKSLSLSSNQIEFMEGLEMLTNLQSLDLSSNKIEIFQGVENLNNLVELNLSYNEGIRIHIMEGSLPKLKVLKLNRCRIKDIDEISKLSQLKVLYIDDNNIESFVPINSLSNLKELSIENNKIPNPEFDGIFNRTMKYSDLSAIKSISGLEVLNLSNNNIVDITDLTNLPNLKELNLFLNKRLDIGPLGKITSLKKLELHYCDITDISVLKNLKNLTRLNIQKNQIDNFDSLEHLEKLKVILIDRNQIKPLSNLSKNSRLHHLFYCYKKNSNELTKICELEKESDLENQRKFREKQQSEAKKLVDDTIAEINKYFTSDNYANYIKERNSESSKWFSEDYIDQELYAFFNDIKNTIVYAFKEENEVNEDPEEFLANPICDIDPNNYIDAAITEAASESHSRFGNDFVNLEDLINAYAEDFFTNACKWMMIHLDDFLLEYFMMHALKFSPESIEKLVDAGVRNILHSQFSLIHIDLSGMEHWMIYLDEIFATCETASLDYQKYIEELKNELAE